MRLFVTLCMLGALAQAKPQGYNYGSGVSGTLTTTGSDGHGTSFLSAPSTSQSVATYGPLGAFHGAGVGSLLSSSSSGTSSSSGYGPSSSSGSSSGTGSGYGSSSAPSRTTYSQGSGISSGVGYTGGQSSSGLVSGGYGNSATNSFAGFGPTPNIGFGGLAGYQAPSYQQQQQIDQQVAFEAPIVHKQFITVAAPEEHENLERVKHLVIGRPQKTYRVVFIKAPSSSSANVKLSAEYAPKEEKTVIYVLSKKDSTLEVNDIATPAPTIPSKPEVFFIKYKTDAEASHAQQQIQAEYDRIEGTSEHTDGGVAPAQSVVGILDAGNSGISSAAGGLATAGSQNFISTSSGTGSLANAGGQALITSTGGSSSSSSSSRSSGSGGGSSGISSNVHKGQSSTYLPPSH